MSDSKYTEKGPPVTSVDNDSGHSSNMDVGLGHILDTTAGSQALHRKLRGKEVQLFAIGGAIGTSLYVQMGSALPKGGPAGLFIAFIIWGCVMWAVNECFAEMVTYVPVPSPFVRFAGEWVDEALGFAMAWNFFLNMAILVPFEIVAMSIMVTFWTDTVPIVAIIIPMIALYAFLNIITVRYFGISEFYLSIFKVLLMIGLFFFTFVTMVGGNPLHEAYGFTYWQSPGAFVEHNASGNTGRFLGILSCIYQASFSICGPEYISMVAAEAENPRRILPSAYRSFVWRILFFFVGSALCMGIVIPYNDPTLAAILGGESAGSGTGAASPYIIAMNRLQIHVLPHIVNALIMTSVFSAGNGLLFSATRVLHGMSLMGFAPKIFSWCTKGGVPLYSLLFSLSFSLLAFLQLGSSSAEVLVYLVYLITCCQLLNYGFTALTYRHFYAALKKQGISRDTLPYKGRFQPYTSYFAMGGTLFMLLAAGYDLFLTGGWDVMWFFLDYGMIGFFILAFIGWKVFFKTRYVRPGTADISLGGAKEEIDQYEALYVAREPGRVGRLIDKVFE
ncbi:Putative amino acid permease/ SLC12A domain-containing protein [Colletotrichum destructivum]|uniref:Amino acid permease/ SLC12A domain-containing protein n=1 Tax=Colletotrichum destructivum TaxID=34406 RepID=A0AAX4IMR5_9PEZI|nr:Putative amino acid permease/ SLC12A domain-containing protein [Colletotrichum destructivum]